MYISRNDTFKFLNYISWDILFQYRHRDGSTKIEAIVNWSRPQSFTRIHQFHELTPFYKRFIKNFSSIATPLTEILKVDKFSYKEKVQTNFDTLTQLVMHVPILMLHYFNHAFEMENNTWNMGIGTILSHGGHPITLFSEKLSNSRHKCST